MGTRFGTLACENTTNWSGIGEAEDRPTREALP